MYEGHFSRAGQPEARETADLQRFRWTDLVARLAATRDLRDEIARIEGGFGAFAEVRRTEVHREGGGKGKAVIYHSASGHGKAGELGLEDAANDAVQGDRETE
ncbi:MAG: hypothetical protein WC692_03635 [Erythrobacter sp.]|jgi:hypothetical protein